MGLKDLFHSDLKIIVSKKGNVKEYIISYPQNKGNFENFSPTLFQNVVEMHNIIVNINTELSFSNKTDPQDLISSLRLSLASLGIPYEYRSFKSASAKSPFEKLFGFVKREHSEDIITFALPKGFSDSNVINLILSLGCEIFVPFEEEECQDYVYKVFNSHYENPEDRYSTFKFVLFISDFVQQSVIRTTVLELEDVEKIVKHDASK